MLFLLMYDRSVLYYDVNIDDVWDWKFEMIGVFFVLKWKWD